MKRKKGISFKDHIREFEMDDLKAEAELHFDGSYGF
jgi:hypothetical protein